MCGIGWKPRRNCSLELRMKGKFTRIDSPLATTFVMMFT
jgi:hypothetical protein